MFPPRYFAPHYFAPFYFSHYVVPSLPAGLDIETLQTLDMIYSPLFQSMLYNADQSAVYYTEQTVEELETSGYPSMIFRDTLP